MSGDNNDYQVGYGKPPKHTRFTKGKSGNPGGRPKGNRSLTEALAEALAERISVAHQGKKKRVEMRDLIARNLCTQAAKGDVRCTALIAKMESRVVPVDPGPALEDELPIKFTLNLEEGSGRPPPPDFLDELRRIMSTAPDRVTEGAKSLFHYAERLKKMMECDEHLKPGP